MSPPVSVSDDVERGKLEGTPEDVRDELEKGGSENLEESPIEETKEAKAAVIAGGFAIEEVTSPDQALRTSRWELWSYYAYYIGNSGIGPFNFAPSQAQNLLFLAGWDPADPTRQTPCTDACVIGPFAGNSQKTINGVILICNGISFAIQAALFLVIGLYADYGRWRPYILWFWTAVCLGVSFGWLGVEDPSQWRTGLALYILGLLSYQACLTFWTSAFPSLARNLSEMQESQRKLGTGETTREAHNTLDMLSRNRLSNIAFTVCSFGELIVLAIMVGILFGLKSDESTENNTKAFSVLVAFAAGVWALLAIPWFVIEKHRPGLPIPPGMNYLTLGVKTCIAAIQEIWKLKDTLIYLIFYFLMGDVLATTVTVVSTIQNTLVSYSTLQLNYLLIVGIGTQMIGIYAFWFVQKRYTISTKSLLCFNVFWILVLTLWGFIGIWANNFGFKKVWEVWAYQAFYGAVVCPWYAVSQTMISEVVPHGTEYLFFALFSIVGKTSSFIGPFVSARLVTDANGNNNAPFGFLFALGAVSCILLFFIDVDRSRRDCKLYLEREQGRLGMRVVERPEVSNNSLVEDNVDNKA